MIANRQRAYFNTGVTRSREWRIQALQKIKSVVKAKEKDILAALKKDLGRSDFESYMAELAMVYEEIEFSIKHLKCWMKPKRVRTPLVLMPAKSRILFEPRGVVLVIAPWNYPVQLLVVPAVGAIAAGNTVVLKPSEMTPATDKILSEIFNQNFPHEIISVVSGGAEVTQDLLKQNFDYIFYTGGAKVGKIVMMAAAENLTPVTLEFGGKSPCVIADDAPFEVTAKRVVWGKFFNAGQTCVAPDYLFVPKKQSAEWLQALKNAIGDLYGEEPAKSPDYPRIVNKGHFDRLVSYLGDGKIVTGGQNSAKDFFIAPTVLTNISTTSRVMSEEIFGPVLPVLEYERMEEVYKFILERDRPLALYLFTGNSEIQKEMLNRIPFGGGCINDTLVHLNSPRLPFGGVGTSGMGAYHGRFSFETFSHRKSVLMKPFWLDMKIRYPPYGNRIQWMKKLFK